MNASSFVLAISLLSERSIGMVKSMCESSDRLPTFCPPFAVLLGGHAPLGGEDPVKGHLSAEGRTLGNFLRRPCGCPKELFGMRELAAAKSFPHCLSEHRREHPVQVRTASADRRCEFRDARSATPREA